MMKCIKVVGVICIVFWLTSCVKEETFPPEPQIFRVDSIPMTLVNQLDTVLIRVKFQDGDGDIGYDEDERDTTRCVICPGQPGLPCMQHPDIDIFFRDQRDSCFQTYKLPKVTPQTNNGSVQGTITIELNTCCKNSQFPCPNLGSGVYDTAVYDIFIRDRAGNFSNIIESPPILVQCTF